MNMNKEVSCVVYNHEIKMQPLHNPQTNTQTRCQIIYKWVVMLVHQLIPRKCKVKDEKQMLSLY